MIYVDQILSYKIHFSQSKQLFPFHLKKKTHIKYLKLILVSVLWNHVSKKNYPSNEILVWIGTLNGFVVVLNLLRRITLYKDKRN